MRGSIILCRVFFQAPKKAFNNTASKAKGRVPWHNDGLNPEINSMAVVSDWMQLVTIIIDCMVVINKIVQQNQLL